MTQKVRRRAGAGIALCSLLVLAAIELVTGQQKTTEPRVEEGTVVGADNVKLFYRKVGDGRDVIVFLHGGPALSMENDGLLMDPLADASHTLIMYDQRGAGRSEVVTDPARLTAASHVRDLEALREHLGIQKMSVIGLSWGSGLAALYADAHPDRVARLVFLTPMPPAKTPFVEQRDKKIDALIAAADMERLNAIAKEWSTANDSRLRDLCVEQFRILVGPYLYSRRNLANADKEISGICGVPAAAIRNQPLVGQTGFTSLGDFDFRPLLAKLKVPVLVVEGEKTNVPLDGTREWVKAAPGARLLMVPNAGHFTLVEQPDALHDIATFLGGHWPAAAREITASR
ncbi:MAG TPA: alpha/beta hydrolase [Vicinamibacterales bacterium]|nr:alpha/beta hydrolase [Vicinamibacterales bacterium]